MAERKLVYLAECYLVACSSGLPWANWQHKDRVLRLTAKYKGTKLGSCLLVIQQFQELWNPCFFSGTHCDSVWLGTSFISSYSVKQIPWAQPLVKLRPSSFHPWSLYLKQVNASLYLDLEGSRSPEVSPNFGQHKSEKTSCALSRPSCSSLPSSLCLTLSLSTVQQPAKGQPRPHRQIPSYFTSVNGQYFSIY